MVVLDELNHLLIAPAIYGAAEIDIIILCIILDQLIRTETLVTFLTVHQRIRKSAEMSGSHPGLRIHQNRTIHTDIVRILLNKFLPPCALDIILKFYAQITVVPGVCKATVDLGAWIYKTSRLCNLHDLVHCLFHYVCPLF